MAHSTPIKSYLDAGIQFAEMSRKQAEELVQSLVKAGEVRRKDAEQLVQSFVERSRETTDRITAIIQGEVGKQLKSLAERFDDVEDRLESIAASVRSGVTGSATVAAVSHDRPAESSSTPAAPATEQPPTEKPAAKKSSAKKSGAKKTGAKKTGAKKTGAKRSGAKKSGAKKSGTKKSSAGSSGAVGSSGVRKVSTKRPG